MSSTSSRIQTITKAQIGANPGGKSGCDGCSLPLTLASSGYDNPYNLAYIVVTSISLVLTLISLVGLRFYSRWAASLSAPGRKHGIKTFSLGILSLIIVFTLSIIDSALEARVTRTTRSYYIVYAFIYIFALIASLALLATVARFAEAHSANIAPSRALWVALGLPGLAALAAIAAYITLIVWQVNIPFNNYYISSNRVSYASDVLNYISYLSRVQQITSLVYWAVYILAVAYVLFTVLRHAKILGALTTLTILAALLMLFAQSVLALTVPAIQLYIYNYLRSSVGQSRLAFSIRTEGLYRFLAVSPTVQNFLFALTPIFIGLAAVFAVRRQRSVSKSYYGGNTTAPPVAA